MSARKVNYNDLWPVQTSVAKGHLVNFPSNRDCYEDPICSKAYPDENFRCVLEGIYLLEWYWLVVGQSGVIFSSWMTVMGR